ncbi:recombinase family protein [Asticcacaulis endophyticus]|uniref:Resolvase n=1 Tax=Asticcacaulis endophyticus TaxID=1395890 RepID=A0A918Q344_9CAUL|nr:recombinase family protein [Asticcacaulis endophyticus]GGZ32152.1 resolvase [Asticcacaulis endophyticus]
MKVALYARYSSDNQRDASISDQFRICRAHAEKQGWQIVEEYSDHAVSGASLLRPGIQALITDAMAGRFQIVLSEAMDRLSRDQEDIAGVFKRMSYAGVKIITLSEGEVSHLHIGLKGTMNALFLKDLAEKTHRGMQGRVELGKSGGGNSYGYDVVRKLDGNGELIRGDRTINAVEADVVRRIYRDFSNGKSPKVIAAEMNRSGIRAPGGGDWGFSTINGNRKRGNGILNNEMYIGRLIWNRQRFVKEPGTGRRQARPNPPSEWVIHDVPELRIIEDELWQAVKLRQDRIKGKSNDNPVNAADDQIPDNHFRERRRPKYLFSGMTKCATCGGGFIVVSATSVGCATARNKGTCSNYLTIRRAELEERVLNALRHRLMEPSLFQEFCVEYTKEVNLSRMEARAAIEAARAEVAKIKREAERLIDLYLSDTISKETVRDKNSKMERRKLELDRFIAEFVEPPPLLHPEMANFYRTQISDLYNALADETEAKRLSAAETIRGIVCHLTLIPENGKLEVLVVGELAGILDISTRKPSKQSQKHDPRQAASSLPLDVKSLGTNIGDSELATKDCSNHKLDKKKSRPDRAASGSTLALSNPSEFEMVAGARFGRSTHISGQAPATYHLRLCA